MLLINFFNRYSNVALDKYPEYKSDKYNSTETAAKVNI